MIRDGRGLGWIKGRYKCYEEEWSRMGGVKLDRERIKAKRKGGPGWKGLGWT